MKNRLKEYQKERDAELIPKPGTNVVHQMIGIAGKSKDGKHYVKLYDKTGNEIFCTPGFDTEDDAVAYFEEYKTLVNQALPKGHQMIQSQFVNLHRAGQHSAEEVMLAFLNTHIGHMDTLDPERMDPDVQHVLTMGTIYDEQHIDDCEIQYCQYCSESLWAPEKAVRAKLLHPRTILCCKDCLQQHLPMCYEGIMLREFLLQRKEERDG